MVHHCHLDLEKFNINVIKIMNYEYIPLNYEYIPLNYLIQFQNFK